MLHTYEKAPDPVEELKRAAALIAEGRFSEIDWLNFGTWFAFVTKASRENFDAPLGPASVGRPSGKVAREALDLLHSAAMKRGASRSRSKKLAAQHRIALAAQMEPVFQEVETAERIAEYHGVSVEQILEQRLTRRARRSGYAGAQLKEHVRQSLPTFVRVLRAGRTPRDRRAAFGLVSERTARRKRKRKVSA